MKWKKIFLNTKKTKYCIVKLYKTKLQMQKAYKEFRPKDGHHSKVLGVHCSYERYYFKKKKEVFSNETGTVFLSLQNCGAGVVAHELMHAVLWARGHKEYKKQYPIIIKNMKEEERVLHNHSYAIMQFYQWYFKVKNKIKL